jgi:hypothetical protein
MEEGLGMVVEAVRDRSGRRSAPNSASRYSELRPPPPKPSSIEEEGLHGLDPRRLGWPKARMIGKPALPGRYYRPLL